MLMDVFLCYYKGAPPFIMKKSEGIINVVVCVCVCVVDPVFSSFFTPPPCVCVCVCKQQQKSVLSLPPSLYFSRVGKIQKKVC